VVHVVIIFGLYVGVDVLISNFVEPQLYGTSTGISPIAVLVAAVFWTWLWGRWTVAGYAADVCLVVLGAMCRAWNF